MLARLDVPLRLLNLKLVPFPPLGLLVILQLIFANYQLSHYLLELLVFCGEFVPFKIELFVLRVHDVLSLEESRVGLVVAEIPVLFGVSGLGADADVFCILHGIHIVVNV